MSNWNRAAPVLTKEREPVEEVSQKTYEQLIERGWCLWECDLLGGEIIVVVRDELVEGMPQGYPAYTSQELMEISGLDEPTIQLVHKAKKEAGAIIAN